MEQGSWAIIHICTVRTARHDAAKKGWIRGPGLLYIFVPYGRPDRMLLRRDGGRGRGLLYIFVPYGRPDMTLLRRDGAGVVGYYTYLYHTDGQIGCC